jgi:hypothetical protein
MTTPRHPLHVVPEPGGPSAKTFPRAGSANHEDDSTDQLTTTDEEHNAMSGTTTTSTNGTGEQLNERGEIGISGWARRVFIEPWSELTGAVIGLALDVVLGLIALAFIRNGVIPAWLDTHGRQGWMGAGAVAGLYLLAELPDAVLRLYGAVCERLDRRYLDALTAPTATAVGAGVAGGEGL